MTKDVYKGIGFVLFFSVILSLAFQSAMKPKKQVVKDVWEEVEMNVSAYCKNSCCCGEWADGYTASGAKAEGKLIAAPPEYAFGTVMSVPDYGIAKVLDRGGAIKGNKIDLLFSTHEEALEWGRQHITVKVKEVE